MILRPAPIFTDISNILCQRPFGTKCPEGARRVEGGNMDKTKAIPFSALPCWKMAGALPWGKPQGPIPLCDLGLL